MLLGFDAIATTEVAQPASSSQGGGETRPRQLRFTPTNFTLLKELRQNVPIEFSTQPETNVHFLGRFKTTSFQIRSFLRQDYPTHDIQPETNPHFLGRFVASKHRINWSLRQLGALDLGTDFPQYFLGKFVPVHHQILLRLRQNAHEDAIAAYVQVIEAAHAVDQEFTITIPPQPGCPVIGPGVGSNPSVTGPGPC